MQIGDFIKINSRKFDGRIDKTWKAELVEINHSLLILYGVFNQEINHHDLGIIECGTVSFEYYWFNNWFNVFCFLEPSGTFRNFYCNINVPPTLKNNVLDYIDLDIDILVEKDFTYKILDLKEFEQNSKRFNYPPEIISQTENALIELQKKILEKEFPFSKICKMLTYN